MSRPSDHFSALAEAYASRRPRYPEELFAYLASVCSKRELAWDCAAGSGQASVPLSRRFNRVIASDLSPAMLAQAPRQRSIQFIAMTAEQGALGHGTVDLVTVAQALHWFDVDRFYAEADRVLVPGGVLAVWTYGKQAIGDPKIDRVLRVFYEVTVGPFWAPERRHVEAGYGSLSFPYRELDPPAFAMEQHWSLEELLGYVGTWSATQYCREATGRDPIQQLRQQLKPLWGDPVDHRRIRWPLSLRLGKRPT